VGIAAWLHGLGLQQYEQAFSDRDDVTVALDPRTADGDGSMVSARLADGRAELGRQPLAQHRHDVPARLARPRVDNDPSVR